MAKKGYPAEGTDDHSDSVVRKPQGPQPEMAEALASRRAAKIQDIQAREIIDSRGFPTIEVDLAVEKGGEFCGVFRASVPSGSSSGEFEVHELRDGETRYGGQGVSKAVERINAIVAVKLRGMEVTKQQDIDTYMVEVLDGTQNEWGWAEEWLGSNAILAVSIAVCRAAAATSGIPLYGYIAQLAQRPLAKFILPVPVFTMISSGRSAGQRVLCEEFTILPLKANSFADAMAIATDVYYELKDIIEKKYGASMCSVGNDGSFCPPLKDDEEGLDLLMESIKASGHEGLVSLGIGVGASDLFDKSARRYAVNEATESAEGISGIYKRWLNRYPIVSIEDPFEQDDWDGYTSFTKKHAKVADRQSFSTLQVVGGTLLASNPRRMQMALEEGACNALLLKLSQAGCITEAIACARMAIDTHWAVQVSGCVGETEDNFLADFAVGIWCGQIKAGAPCRSEHVAKCNQLLRIEEALEGNCSYGGQFFRHPQRWAPWRVKLLDRACPLAHLDMVGSKEFEALKDTDPSAKAKEQPKKAGGLKPKKEPKRECSDCGRMQTAGRVDPADGMWYCDDCWASMTVEKGPLKCEECKKIKSAGSFDPSDGMWYCDECWAAF